jgi:hypothetical protein
VDKLAYIVISGFVGFLFALLLRQLEPKVRLVFWVPHSFLFHIPIPADSTAPALIPGTSAQLLTHAITIQNLGRRTAENVEIVLQTKPDYFQLAPALPYAESVTPAGQHVISVNTLARREFFTIEFLSYVSHPNPLVIRSTAGAAESMPVQSFRVIPPLLARIAWVLIFIGLAFTVYWGGRIVMFVLKGIGVI